VVTPESTCWTVIKAAAAGVPSDREEFVRRYNSIVAGYLAYRWRGTPSLLAELDDALQEVFIECFKKNGVLDRAERERGFRPFLYGVVRNVALRIEADRRGVRERQTSSGADLDNVPDSEDSLSRIFDQAWAKELMREAGRWHEDQARRDGAAACRRVTLLRLRFHEGLSIREIAARWTVDAQELHHEYARARAEFKSALMEIMAYHRPGSPAEVERECADLLQILNQPG
jgi:RNA polymerase sigma-70 factor (ECF subfamily)